MKKKSPPSVSLPHPKAHAHCFGYEAIEQHMLKDWQQNHFPHGFLLTGTEGIGKATFAYRCIRFLFAGNKETATDFSIAKTDKIHTRIANGNWSDLLVLEAEPGKDITVDRIREIGQFLHLTPAESPYRVVLIDSLDHMNTNAANALLKLLEEPPAHAYIFLLCHHPGRVLPTIRSRCRTIACPPLSKQAAEAVLTHMAPFAPTEEARAWLPATSFAPGLALRFSQSGVISLYEQVLRLLATAPNIDPIAIHAIGDQLAAKDAGMLWAGFTFMMQRFWSLLIKRAAGCISLPLQPVEQEALSALSLPLSVPELLSTMENMLEKLRVTDYANLDKKQMFILLCAPFLHTSPSPRGM